MDIRKKIAAQVRAARDTRGWSVAECARRCGVSRPTIMNIENGQAGHIRALESVVKALGLVLVVRARGVSPRNEVRG